MKDSEIAKNHILKIMNTRNFNYLGEIYLYKKEYKNSYDVFKRSVEIN